MTLHEEVWEALRAHLDTVFSGDAAGYAASVTTDLSLYKWFVTPHRQDGVGFHLFMTEHGWAGTESAGRALSGRAGGSFLSMRGLDATGRQNPFSLRCRPLPPDSDDS